MKAPFSSRLVLYVAYGFNARCVGAETTVTTFVKSAVTLTPVSRTELESSHKSSKWDAVFGAKVELFDKNPVRLKGLSHEMDLAFDYMHGQL